MFRNSWRGIMTVLEIQHHHKGKIIWEQYNLLNLLHEDGEEFILKAVFTGGQLSTIIPENYYLGLDNRAGVAVSDTMDDLVGEPSGNGYQRQVISSSGDFTISFDNTHFMATSPIVAFHATSNSWGPVNNLFLTNKSDNTGYLISTVVLNTAMTLVAGDSVTMRLGMKLKDCS